jgi:hypothetical protein
VSQKLLKSFRHGRNVVEDEQIRYQVMVVDHLPSLVVLRVFGQQTSSAERHPLNKQIECLTLVCGGLNRAAEFNRVLVGHFARTVRR